MFIEANNTESGHSFRSAMFRAISERRCSLLLQFTFARHKNSRFELNDRHSTPKGEQNFKLERAINIPLLRSDLICG